MEPCERNRLIVLKSNHFTLPSLSMSKSHFLSFLKTPPIWKKKQFDILQFEFPFLDMENFHPKEIPTNLRLGHQMEFVFKELMNYSENYELILYNLPIRNQERTLGEIDFILKDNDTNHFIHVELTYKFYLLDPEIPRPIHRLIGPNRKDRFFDKMEKIKNEQFPLLHSSAGIQALEEHGINHQTIQHQCCFKAQVFIPYQKENLGFGFVNKETITGYWLRLEDFKSIDFIKHQFYVPRKSDWVIQPTEEALWKSHAETLLEVKLKFEEKRAPMVWRKKSKNNYEKFFVVWW